MILETNGQALVQAVRSIPGRLHLCLEEGELSAWLHELLAPHVHELVVTVPRSTRGQPKDDLRDAGHGRRRSESVRSPRAFSSRRFIWPRCAMRCGPTAWRSRT